MQPDELKARAREIWGMDDWDEILRSAAMERVALGQLWDENEALKVHNRRLRVLADLAKRTFEQVVDAGGLFLPQKVRDTWEKFQIQYNALDVTRADSQEIINENLKRTP